MRKCGCCLRNDKHETRCPNKLPAGPKKRQAVAQWKKGFESGLYTGSVPNDWFTKYWWLGWKLGYQQGERQTESFRLDQAEASPSFYRG